MAKDDHSFLRKAATNHHHPLLLVYFLGIDIPWEMVPSDWPRGEGLVLAIVLFGSKHPLALKLMNASRRLPEVVVEWEENMEELYTVYIV